MSVSATAGSQGGHSSFLILFPGHPPLPQVPAAAYRTARSQWTCNHSRGSPSGRCRYDPPLETVLLTCAAVVIAAGVSDNFCLALVCGSDTFHSIRFPTTKQPKLKHIKIQMSVKVRMLQTGTEPPDAVCCHLAIYFIVFRHPRYVKEKHFLICPSFSRQQSHFRL